MLVYIFSLVVSIALFLNAPQSMDKAYMLSCIMLVAAELICFFFNGATDRLNKAHKTYIRHTYIFAACFVIVFFQCDLDYVLGFIDSSDDYLWINPAIVCKALSLSTIAFSAFLIGCDFLKSSSISFGMNRKNIKFDTTLKKELCIFGYFLLGLYLIFVPRDYLLGGYNEGVDRGSANVLLILLQAVFVSMFAMYAYDYKEDHYSEPFFRKLKGPLLLSTIYILVILVTGRRTEAIRIASLVLVVYGYCKGNRVNTKLLITYSVIAMLIFSVTSILRSKESSTFSEGVSQITDVSSILPFTLEYANSVNTLHVAVDNYTDRIDYNYGITFFSTFFVLIPGLDRIVSNYFPTYTLRSESVITYLGLDEGENWGMGTSCVADVYIAFGPIGVVVIFFLLGLFLKYLEAVTFKANANPYLLVLSFGCCSQLMYVCRGAIGNMFLSWSYATILLFILIRKKNATAL